MNFQALFSPARLAVTYLPIRAWAAMGMLAGLPPTGTAAETATVAPGARITFQASAEGTPAPVFQWRKNGAAIAGATGQTFSIASATAFDAASYRVTATNEGGSADSPEIVIEVGFAGPAPNTPPTITLHPSAPASAIAGETVSLTVAASGSPSPTFQWLKNGLAMQGATQATLTIAALSASDSAIYAAVATNVAGAAMSNSVTLTVASPNTPNPPLPPPPPPPPADVVPVITTQPAANLNVTAGSTVTLGVGASGTPAPTFQWRINGVPIAGATNALLTLTGVTTNNSGSYSAVAINSAGSAQSNPAVLVVSSPTPVAPPTPTPTPPTPTPPPPPPVQPGPPLPPTIAAHPTATQTAVAGTTVQLAVAATGNPSPNLQWRKNGASIVGATGATLAFTSITTADAATYSVLATNASGTAVSQNAILIVNSRPLFSTQPAPQAVALGARAIFTTVVSAIPGANLQWRKDGVALPGATRSSLTIDFVGTTDLGVYSIVATNTWGSTTSVDAALMLAAPPVITAQPANQTVAARSNVTFVAAAFGAPFPTFQWKKDGVSISGATATTLSLDGVEKSDEGFYSVEASNAMGWAVSHRAALVVNNTSNQAQPGASTGSAQQNASSGSRIVNLSVRAKAGGGNSLIVGFVINGSDSKPMLVRGIGPTLSLFGLSDSLADPTLSLYSGANLSASNDDWRANNNALQIIGTSARLGAFSLPESAADSALLTALNAGAYTVQIDGKGPASGVALVEVYDAAPENPASLINLSVRTHVGSGAGAPNLGFVIAGGPKRVVIRAVGPTLEAFGVPDVISDPKLELYRGEVRIDQNDNWGGSEALSSTFDRIGAFGLKEPGSRDAALLVSLEPGAYTVIVSGVGGSMGVALVEIYDVP